MIQTLPTRHDDAVFAPIDYDHVLERLAGGNETEVFRSDDGRWVIKLKSELGDDQATALAHAREMRAAAEEYAACLGPEHSIPSHYLLARDSQGHVQVLVVQPFVAGARPLHAIAPGSLAPAERAELARSLRALIRRAEGHYLRRRSLPDLYGRTSSSASERRRLNQPHMLPWRVWSFLVQRHLLRSHNLLYTGPSDRRVVLVDYDFVRRGPLYRQVYFLTRMLLYWRDRLAIWLLLER